MIPNYDNSTIKDDVFRMKKLKFLSDITSFFSCDRCGICCNESNPSLYYPEIIHFGLDKVVWDEIRKSYRLIGYYRECTNEYGKHTGHPCEFYVHEGGRHGHSTCKTQRYKPLSCKIYPFSFGHSDLKWFSIILCPLGLKIISSYMEYYHKVKGEDFTVSTVKLLGNDDEKLAVAQENIIKVFKGKSCSIYELIKIANNVESGKELVTIIIAIPVDIDEMVRFNEYLKKVNIKQNN